MTITMTEPNLALQDDPFLLETVATDHLIVGISEDSGPVARTCNCFGSCGAVCATGCCNLHSTTCLER